MSSHELASGNHLFNTILSKLILIIALNDQLIFKRLLARESMIVLKVGRVEVSRYRK